MSDIKNYINYIVNDILKSNIIKINDDTIVFPWMMEDIIAHYNDPGRELVFYKHTVTEMSPWKDVEGWYPNDMSIFSEYVKAKYGVRDTEVGRVWRYLSEELYEMAPEYKNNL